ncbi:hypothetical protein M422DRAFT_268186 [Sphaerobolus stellatus SS14]|uniref:Cytokinin riboside 5'-monophosphate phosphoribohydrolase n=1 Tax=Sphaerobolus stellatus (strain SS14) TaxID=990650 RepID=A0A0C9UYV1_SPHS4|nr:hypothetical protein M422DRAFT_268186 [Sphaerobolus stellatus SS14]
MSALDQDTYPNAVAVFCGSSPGNEPAFEYAARSLGETIAKSGIGFVYGGGNKGIMGVVSRAAAHEGSDITGVVPYAMVKEKHEVKQDSDLKNFVFLNEVGMEKVKTIVVHSMHERKVEMAQRVRGFFGLPGGYGTFEELMEMITWTQLGIHEKPIIILNVLGFYDALRDLIRSGVSSGFIHPSNERIVVFIDGPADKLEHTSYDWGTSAIEALNAWKKPEGHALGFDWKKRLPDEKKEKPNPLDVS